ncbi:MAG: MerR family transcriptional regulator [Paludibacteraceae bacterium]|nr:MerR family transcriptional regulator [Paludibacteraceae bacterium]
MMEEPKKVYYSISEVEEITHLPASNLHYWEKQFEQLSPRKDNHGNRYYTEADIELIKRIKYLRDEMHITRIAAIKNELQSGGRRVDQRQRAYDILMRVRQELVNIRANI